MSANLSLALYETYQAALKSNDPRLDRARLHRGYNLARRKSTRILADGRVLIQGKDRGTAYIVTRKGCERDMSNHEPCQDRLFRPSTACKHQIARWLLYRAYQRLETK